MAHIYFVVFEVQMILWASVKMNDHPIVFCLTSDLFFTYPFLLMFLYRLAMRKALRKND